MRLLGALSVWSTVFMPLSLLVLCLHLCNVCRIHVWCVRLCSMWSIALCSVASLVLDCLLLDACVL